MNDYDPKEMKKASQYLQDKLEELESTTKKSDTSEKIEEEKKQSKLKQFVSSIFKR